MKNNQFYAIQATAEGKQLLCWMEKKHLYFASKVIGFKNPPAPTLFRSRKEANAAINETPVKGGNLKQFFKVTEASKVKVVPVQIII